MAEMIRLADDVRISAIAGDGIVGRADRVVLRLPGEGSRLRTIAVLLRTPRLETWLREELARMHPQTSVDGLMSRLLAEGICVPWDLGVRLSELHGRTTLPSEWPAVSPEVETSRILRESAVEGSVELPQPARLDLSLSEVLTTRRTARQFNPAAMPLADLGTLLALAFGSHGSVPDTPLPLVWGAPSSGRTYPSGGALYPVEVLVYPIRVEALPAGFYYYQALSHHLVPFAPAQHLDDLVELLCNHPIEHSSALLLLWMDFARPSLGRYGEKAYRLALLEAGHIAQNGALVAAGLRLAVLPICGFDDAGLSRAAGLNFPFEAVLYTLAVGNAG